MSASQRLRRRRLHSAGRSAARSAVGIVAGGLLAFATAGCGSDLGAGLQPTAVTPYAASNALSPTGHHVTDLGDGRYRITATGSAATPKARVEKIALARAAEFGVERSSKFFQAATPQFSIRCGKREYLEKGEKRKLPARGFAVVEVDVTYANSAADPSYRATKDVSEALQAEIQAESVAEEARQSALAEVTAQCGV